jgi:protein-S-isoprenylcysteine O-methyltransferase Ste14
VSKIHGQRLEQLYPDSRSGGRIAIITALAGFFYITLLAFLIFLSFRTDRALHLPTLPEYPVNFLISAPLFLLGLVFWLWSVLAFTKLKENPVSFQAPPKLITNGPYAFSRNPMLAGVFFLLFGIGFAFQSLSLVFFYTPLFIFLNYLELRYFEEYELEKRFGTKYMEYKKRTPMFYGKRRIR